MADSLERQLAENLFQAIDTIATKRANSIKFDKTLTCQIVDDSNSDKGEYIVSNAGSEFFAYSENTSYSNDTWVYVTVPNGDMDQQKLIVGKYVADNTEYFNYRNPLDTYLDITGNLIDGDVDNEATVSLIANAEPKEIIIWQAGAITQKPYVSNLETEEEKRQKLSQRLSDIETQYTSAVSLVNNYNPPLSEAEKTSMLQALMEQYTTEKTQVELDLQTATVNALNNTVSSTTQQLSRFDRLGIQANFQTLLDKYNIVDGHYGLRIDIVSMDPASTSTVTEYNYHTFKLDNEIMFGNPYSFLSWSQQQCVFDISELGDIVGMQLIFYQDSDFIDENNQLIPNKSLPQTIPAINTPEYEEYVQLKEQWDTYLSMANILVKDIYISLGYDLDEFSEDTLLLYSFEPTTYSAYLTDVARSILEERNKTLPEIERINLNTDQGTQEGLKIVNEKNLYLRWVHVDKENNLVQAISSIEELGTWEEDITGINVPIPHNMAKVHWYRWTLQDNINDSLAGPFWKEINVADHMARIEGYTGATEKPNSYDCFEWLQFYPDTTLSNEKIKVIVEYPTQQYLQYNINNDIDTYLDNKTAELKEQAIAEFSESSGETYNENNLLHKTAVQILYNLKLEDEKENYTTSTLGESGLYESPELVFTNEHEVPNSTSIDLVQALQLICDAEYDESTQSYVGYNGVYRIYNADGQIMNSNEASRTRIISAKFNTVITGDTILDNAELIKWYFPCYQSMIEYPVEGCEYNLRDWSSISWSALGLAEDVAKQNEFKRNYPFFNLSDQETATLQNDSTFATFAAVTPDGQWFCIERQGVSASSTEPRTAGQIVPTQLEQIFRIKPVYKQTAINNVIKCEIYKNNKVYKAEFSLSFGTSGSNGTDYTLTVDFEEKVNGIWKPLTAPAVDYTTAGIRLIPHIYDYDYKDVTKNYEGQISYSVVAGNEGFTAQTINGYYTLTPNTSDRTKFYNYIIKVSVGGVSVNVKATNDSENTTINNNTQKKSITLNLTQYFPIAVRFDQQYIALDGDNRVTYDATGVNPTYYKGEYTLYQLIDNVPTKVPNVKWFTMLGDQSIVDALGNLVAYYPQIDVDTGILIVPSMYMTGNELDVSIIAQVDNQTVWCQPLYISQELYSSAFLNSWDGSLCINEEDGTIMSAMVGAGFKDSQNLFNGVLMGCVGEKTSGEDNADTGLFGYHEGQQSFGLRIDGTAFLGKSGHGQILFDGNSGEIASALYYSDGYGLRMDLDDAYMDLYGRYGAHIHIGTNSMNDDNSAFFSIIDNNENPLIMIDPENSTPQMFIQTDNFSDVAKTGICFDLLNGDLTGYDFTLNALNSTHNGGVILSSTAPYLNVMASNGAPLFYVDDDDYFLQTADFDNDNKTGVCFDLSGGQLIGYDFDIYASGGGGEIVISSSPPDGYPLTIGENFAVDWKGNLIANKANITGSIKASSFLAGYYDDNDRYHVMTAISSNGLTIFDGGLYDSDITNQNASAIANHTIAQFGSQLYIGYEDSALIITSTDFTLKNPYGELCLESSGLNINASGSGSNMITIGSNYSALIRVGSMNIPINPSSKMTAGQCITVSKSYENVKPGWKVLGVVGYNLNAGGSGGISQLNVYECYPNKDGLTVTVAVRNLSSKDRKKGLNITVYVLVTPMIETFDPDIVDPTDIVDTDIEAGPDDE